MQKNTLHTVEINGLEQVEGEIMFGYLLLSPHQDLTLIHFPFLIYPPKYILSLHFYIPSISQTYTLLVLFLHLSLELLCQTEEDSETG